MEEGKKAVEHSFYYKMSSDLTLYYFSLIEHLEFLFMDKWWDTTEVNVKYHAKKLGNIWANTSTHLEAITHIYIYLQDANKGQW